MNKLESTLTCVIFALILVLLGCGSYVHDLHNELLKQRVTIFKYCVEDFGVNNCRF